VTASIERWPVAGAFTIARGAKTFVDVVMVEIAESGMVGRGEGTPIYYHGETAASVLVQVEAAAAALEGGVRREALLEILPRGAARNAIDAAIWDLEARLSATSACEAAGLASTISVTTAFTLSLDTPAAMEEAARCASGRYPLLKLKLAGEGDRERVAAVRRGAPYARLIVDANEAWTGRDIVAEAAALLPYGVELIEQPVRAGEDHLLDGLSSPIPLCADESCHDRADLARYVGRYAAINVKLDKAGGLTEALRLVADARAAGMEVMIGCMLSTSLGVAPAFLLAGQARWVDLDGPLLLARDREGGFRFTGGTMIPSPPGFWG
jgi:L-alanine-DL-glutamate epimerase-like enolase superfamily enzyme